MIMIQRRLRDQLNLVAARYRRLRFWQALAVAWFAAALIGLVAIALPRLGGPSLALPAPWLGAAAAVFTLIGWWKAHQAARDTLWLARRVEANFPELQTRLLAAVEQQPDPSSGQLGYLQSHLIEEALRHARRRPWTQIVPTSQMLRAVLSTAAALGLLVAVLVGLQSPLISTAQASLETIEPPPLSDSDFSVTVDPGNAEIEKGTSLLVLATVAGSLPAEAALIWTNADGVVNRLAMSRTLKDPVFGARIPSVVEPIDYHVEMGGRLTPQFHVDVFEYPRLERADARLVYPAYSGMEERFVQDVRTISVVEGTKLTLIGQLNKPVANALLLEDGAEPIAMTTTDEAPLVRQAEILCDRTRKLTLELVDDRGRKNVRESTFTINVVPNVPVVLKPLFPARDLEASPLEEIDLKASFWDDLGIKKLGLTYSLAGEEPVEVVLGEEAAAKEKHELAHVVRLEDLNAKSDQLLSYHWWAEDLDADGQPRRTESDMYFAEVRPFEEIFRQGEQPPGGQNQQQSGGQGQGENEQSAQKLGELQKQIINATWKVVRRETESKVSEDFDEDVRQILLSQQDVRDQAGELSGQLQDAESLEHAAAVVAAVERAIASLQQAHEQPASGPLRPALAAEQEAYQAMLKLRAREHRVARQQRNSSSASASARSAQQQRQFEELDLQEEENRYESQREAQEQQPESPEEQENRQVLNRLRELARRQHDLNDRLKELQTSLEEAATEEQKEEVRRQLKRLEEEQQQILRDTEELQSRMDTAENQERMATEREQLEQTREQVQRAAEALENERVTQAAASGTRAEENFQELRDEFRRRNSTRFNEEMRQMRDAAREMEKTEQDIATQMAEKPPADESSQAKSLSDDGAREQTAQQLADQRKRLTDIQEQMRQTIEQAESTEPLLTERLYETARKIEDKNLDRALQAAEASVRRGLLDDARRQEQAAGQGVAELREGVERAAEAVLGDDAEALRRAREELQQLSRELNDEIARNNPDSEAARAQQDDRQGDSESADGSQPENAENRDGGENPDADERPQQRSAGDRSEQDPSEPREGGGRRPGQSSEGQPSEDEAAENRAPASGEQPMGQGQRPGQPQQSQPGEGQGQPGSEQEQQPGDPSQRQNSPEQQAGNGGQSGQRQNGENPQPQSGRQQGGSPTGRRLTDSAGGGGTGPHDEVTEYAPLTGNNFREWSDRLRDVEEIVDDPELRAEAARIRERARDVRAEFKRHSETPQWDLVESEVSGPLRELRERISEELLRRASQRAVVPLDRDPVPPAWSTKTRLYYERLGKGE